MKISLTSTPPTEKDWEDFKDCLQSFSHDLIQKIDCEYDHENKQMNFRIVCSGSVLYRQIPPHCFEAQGKL